MSEVGILLVSHSHKLASGLVELILQVASEIPLTYVGGTADGEIGTSFESVLEAVEANPAQKLLAFYDLGSARMNIELVAEMTDKEVHIQSVPVVEGTYTAAALLQAGASQEEIQAQLAELRIRK